MQGFGRAVYTRCFTGISFDASVSLQEGQQIFSTSRDIGLPKKTLSLIEAEIRRDIYNAGMRSYLKEACRFLNCNGTSLILHYSWPGHNETGGKEYGLTKALIGDFESYPMEYNSSVLFTEEKYFFDYPDANGQPISAIRQLHSFRDEAPPQFNLLEYSNLFGVPSITFKDASSFVATDYTSERVRAAVCHLVRQFGLPNNQRTGIAFKGTIDQIRYLFAAIGYAFSAANARKIPFTIALPPVGFSYNFSTAALVGWDVEDPDLTKLNRMPNNLILLEDLPEADDSVYSLITKYDDNHHKFIYNYITKNDVEIEDYLDAYYGYVDPQYLKRKKEEARIKEADDVGKKADEDACKKANDKTRKKASDKDRSDADEKTRRKADDEALRKADEEARRKADEEAHRKADEEARRKAHEEAGRKAHEEARRKADEEARRKADEEARRKADEEARKKADEEARKKATAVTSQERVEICRIIGLLIRDERIKLKSADIALIGYHLTSATLNSDKTFEISQIMDVLIDIYTVNDENAFIKICLELCKKYEKGDKNPAIHTTLVLIKEYYNEHDFGLSKKAKSLISGAKSFTYSPISRVFQSIKTQQEEERIKRSRDASTMKSIERSKNQQSIKERQERDKEYEANAEIKKQVERTTKSIK